MQYACACLLLFMFMLHLNLLVFTYAPALGLARWLVPESAARLNSRCKPTHTRPNTIDISRHRPTLVITLGSTTLDDDFTTIAADSDAEISQ